MLARLLDIASRRSLSAAIPDALMPNVDITDTG
jgi:hypothetical protein